MHTRLLALLALATATACGSKVPAVSAPVAVSAPPTATASATAAPVAPSPAATGDEDVEDVATRLGAAWTACDTSAALALSVSYEDVVAMSRKTIDRADWESTTRSFADERCREFREAHARVVGAKVVGREHHAMADDPERLRRDVEAVYVQLVVERDGAREQRGLPLLFVDTAHGFRFAAKH